MADETPRETPAAEPSASTRDVIGLADALTRYAGAGAVALAGLYVVGVLVVNLDLARYGLFNIDLARPEYAMAGALWVALTLASLWSFYAIRTLATDPNWLRRRGWWMIPFLTIAPVSTLLGAVQYRPGGPWWHFWLGPAVVIANGLAASWGRGLLGEALRDRTYVGATGGIPSLLLALGVYSVVVFPYVPRQFGGGRKAVVDLVLTGPPPLLRAALRLPASDDERRIGPVLLLLDTGSTVVVTAQDSAFAWSPWAGATNPVVALDKRLVSAVIYRSSRAP